MKKLIHEEWTTDEDVMTDENGFLTLEGYRGKYSLSANGKRAYFTLDKNKKEQGLTMK